MFRRLLPILPVLLIIVVFSCTDDTGPSAGSGPGLSNAENDLMATPVGESPARTTANLRPGAFDRFHPAYHGTIAIGGSGDLAGTVVDPRDNTPIANITVNITLPDGSPAGIPPVVSDNLGKFGFTGINDIDYLLTLEDPNYITLEMWTSVTDSVVTTLPPAWFIPHPVIKKGTACGEITDAVSGQPVGNAHIEFRAGMDAPDTEPVLYTVTGGAFGHWQQANMDAGVYTGKVTHTGYMDGKFNIYVIGAETRCNQNVALSPIILGDEMRIVLHWGAVPADLDSHLWAPHNGCEIQNPFHLYYVTRGTHGCRMYFDLDLDDVTSYGPETTTIVDSLDNQSPRVNEMYTFAVHDYTNRASYSSSAMSNSPGLRVDVLTSQWTQTFYMPPNTPATVWSVFDAVFDGTEWILTPVNNYYYQPDPAQVH